MIKIIRKLCCFFQPSSLLYSVRKDFALAPLCRSLACAWWRGMQPCGKAVREEIEALEQIRDRWRSR